MVSVLIVLTGVQAYKFCISDYNSDFVTCEWKLYEWL